MHESLADILERAGARKINSVERTAAARFTFYSVRGKLLIYVEYTGGGWDVFTPVHNGNGVAETLDAVQAYLGLPPGCQCSWCKGRAQRREWSERVNTTEKL